MQWHEYIEEEPVGVYCKKCGEVCDSHAEPGAGTPSEARDAFTELVVGGDQLAKVPFACNTY